MQQITPELYTNLQTVSQRGWQEKFRRKRAVQRERKRVECNRYQTARPRPR